MPVYNMSVSGVRKTILWRAWLFFVTCGVVGYLSAITLAGGADPSENQGPGRKISEQVSEGTPETSAPGGGASGDRAAGESASRNIAQRLQYLRTEGGGDLRYRLVSLLGLFVLVGMCWLLSNNKGKINWRLVAWGLTLQLLFGVLVLKTTPGLWVFSRLNEGTLALLNFTKEGTRFLFSSFVSGKIDNGLVNFTFDVLPTIIFFSSLMTVGYYLGIMQWVVKAFAVVMQKTMKCSGAETLSTAANIFVGQTEAPLMIKPYVKDMTQSELLAVMVGGFANTAGGVLAAYVGMLHQYFPDIAGHLIAQSVMSAPAALVCAKIVWPETGKPLTGEHVKFVDEKIDANIIDAASRGASEGLSLAFNVAAMLLAFIALIAMSNAILQKFCLLVGLPRITLEGIFGVPGALLSLIMGVPWQDCWVIGKLVGVKTVVNEFVAYLQLAQLLESGQPVSYRSVVIASYALSGFANFSSIAIQIGGISGIAPTRRHDLAKLGLLAMGVGSIATFMTAAIAGILVS